MQPYPAYCPSGVPWLGDVPEHWGTMALRWCSVRYAGGTPDRNKDHYWDDGTIPWINSGAVNQKLITEPSALITDEGFAGGSAKWIPSGALVMALAGQGRTKGMVAQLAIQTTCNQSMAAIVPDERVSARYVFWLLDAQYEVIRNFAGGEQRDGLNLEILGDLPVVLPTLHEQRAIAAFLDRETERIDALVAKKRQLIERLQEYRTALITRTVTRGLPPDAALAAGLAPSPRLKPSGVEWLGDVPEHWEVKALGRVVVLQRGHDLPADDREDGEIPVVSSAGVSGSHHLAVAEGPGIVTGRYGSIGDFHLIESAYWPLNTTLYSVDLYGNEVRFVRYLLMNLKPLFLVNAAKSAVPGVDRNDLHPVPTAVPLLEEQEAIATFLDRETERIDKITNLAEEAIERLQEYRTALITAAVTGKVDVRGAATAAAGLPE